jgi:UPF0716 protein FxsA
MTRLLLPILLLALPIGEIAVFIKVGQWIGVVGTIALVLLSAVAGVFLLRHQGLRSLRRINRDLRDGRFAEKDLAEGFLVFVAAILLIIPGFLTDIIALLLLTPPARHFIWHFLRGRVRVQGFRTGRRRNGRERDDVVDLSPEEFRHQDETRPDWRERIDRRD